MDADRIERIKKNLASAEEAQWEAAREIWEELRSGTTQRALGEVLGLSQTHVCHMAKTWELRDCLGNQRFNDAYHSPEVRGPKAAKPVPPKAEETLVPDEIEPFEQALAALPAQLEPLGSGDPGGGTCGMPKDSKAVDNPCKLGVFDDVLSAKALKDYTDRDRAELVRILLKGLDRVLGQGVSDVSDHLQLLEKVRKRLEKLENSR